ncbi:MAG: hypothetical protein M1305_06110 [Candidatus Marsarchaeota archaeon]|nr:hypothetical protein [Candidatus Marsarchaeota archaeon]
MPMLKRDLTRRLIEKCHFEFSEAKGHNKLSLKVNGRTVALTFLSRSYSELDDSMLRSIAHEIGGITLRQLIRLCECTISRDEYMELLRQNGRLD